MVYVNEYISVNKSNKSREMKENSPNLGYLETHADLKKQKYRGGG